MKPIGAHNYFIYIITNIGKTVLYIGVTNDLGTRLIQHEISAKTSKRTFAGRYNCFYLIYFERFDVIEYAIEREKEVKGWSRKKKEALIATTNPDWKFLNDLIE